jgi:hypothetical protein
MWFVLFVTGRQIPAPHHCAACLHRTKVEVFLILITDGARLKNNGVFTVDSYPERYFFRFSRGALFGQNLASWRRIPEQEKPPINRVGLPGPQRRFPKAIHR